MQRDCFLRIIDISNKPFKTIVYPGVKKVTYIYNLSSKLLTKQHKLETICILFCNLRKSFGWKHKPTAISDLTPHMKLTKPAKLQHSILFNGHHPYWLGIRSGISSE